MKKLFISAIPICLVSYILFGISVGILGTKPHHGNTGEYTETGYIKETVTDTGEWTLTDVKPNITLKTGGVNAYVVQSQDENIHLQVTSHGKKADVIVTGDKSSLTFEIHPPEITFGDIINFGQVFWLEDIFHNTSDIQAIIAFPKLLYDSLDIDHGSGTLMVDGLNAAQNDIDIGSGRFEFCKSEQYTASDFRVNLGSGSAVIGNMQTENFDINIGSGSFNFNGLSGAGSIDMGSGNGSIAYSSLNDDQQLDMGSGNLTLYLPDYDGCVLEADIGSGSIDIDAYDVKRTVRDYEELTLGNGESYYNIDQGSGKVYIRNTSAYTTPEMFKDRPFAPEKATGIIAGIVIGTDGEFTTIYSSSWTDVGQVTENNADISSDIIDKDTANSSSSSKPEVSVPEIPNAPNAPEAPEVPDAPNPPEI